MLFVAAPAAGRNRRKRNCRGYFEMIRPVSRRQRIVAGMAWSSTTSCELFRQLRDAWFLNWRVLFSSELEWWMMHSYLCLYNEFHSRFWHTCKKETITRISNCMFNVGGWSKNCSAGCSTFNNIEPEAEINSRKGVLGRARLESCCSSAFFLQYDT